MPNKDRFHDAVRKGLTKERWKVTHDPLFLNFAQVEYLNSAGIAIVIGILTQTRQRDQRLLLAGLTPHYQKVLTMMGVTQYAPIFATEDAARLAVG